MPLLSYTVPPRLYTPNGEERGGPYRGIEGELADDNHVGPSPKTIAKNLPARIGAVGFPYKEQDDNGQS